MENFYNLKLKDKIMVSFIFLALIFLAVQKIFFSGGSMVDNRVKEELFIGDVKVMVEEAETDNEKYKGLSFYNTLGDNEGMLFVHNGAGQYKYVMRDMNFDLDFIFIRDGKVVDIAKNVSKDFKGVVQGATDYDMVLEVPAGWVDRNGVELGDEVESRK